MAKKKILKLTDEQYYKYIMSLKNDSVINDSNKGELPESLKKSENNKSQ